MLTHGKDFGSQSREKSHEAQKQFEVVYTNSLETRQQQWCEDVSKFCFHSWALVQPIIAVPQTYSITLLCNISLTFNMTRKEVVLIHIKLPCFSAFANRFCHKT